MENTDYLIYYLALAPTPSISDTAIVGTSSSDLDLTEINGFLSVGLVLRPRPLPPSSPLALPLCLIFIFFRIKKPTSVTPMTRTKTPRATPGPIKPPLFELDLPTLGKKVLVGVENAVEVAVEGALEEFAYGAIIAGSEKLNFSSQHVEFLNPQHQEPSAQVHMSTISVRFPPFFMW
jgi:hypothetical protein